MGDDEPIAHLLDSWDKRLSSITEAMRAATVEPWTDLKTAAGHWRVHSRAYAMARLELSLFLTRLLPMVKDDDETKRQTCQQLLHTIYDAGVPGETASFRLADAGRLRARGQHDEATALELFVIVELEGAIKNREIFLEIARHLLIINRAELVKKEATSSRHFM